MKTIWTPNTIITASKMNNIEYRLSKKSNNMDIIYEQTIWKIGEPITCERLNKIENALHIINEEFIPYVWKEDEIISSEELNRIENELGD